MKAKTLLKQVAEGTNLPRVMLKGTATKVIPNKKKKPFKDAKYKKLDESGDSLYKAGLRASAKGGDNVERRALVSKYNASIAGQIVYIKKLLREAEKKAMDYSKSLNDGQNGWKYSGDLGRIDETLFDVADRMQWLEG